MEVVQVLIFVAIVAVAIMKQLAKAKKEAEARSQSIPVPVEVEIEEEPMTAPIPVTRKPQRSTSQKKQQVTVTHVASKPELPQNQTKIKLSTREEARRAFIYSEIFNRKY